MSIPGEAEPSPEVALLVEELNRAVELTLSPTASHDDRCRAYNACESFKENSPWCAQAGLLLVSGTQYSPGVKHFGLQLMEHTVKYRWTQISQAEKIFIKENAMKLLYLGGWETSHLNDALARLIVEMVKREWPQQWPTLLAELSEACSQGHRHTQIVLHVFLRLAEDVAILQTLENNQRRKDINQGLTSNMSEIFGFFMRLIELHVQEFREKKAAGDYAAAGSHVQVVQVVLLTLTGYVEWVSVTHVVMNNGRLLQILCILLQDDVFQLPAAECLLQIVDRKGSTKERKPLVILFSKDAIECIHRAAVASINIVDEAHYLFLKKFSQVLVGLAQQLTSLWSCVTEVDSWLPVLLETMVLLTSHPSLTIAHAANSVWIHLMRHEQLSKLPTVVAVVPRWMQAMAPKVLKVSYPAARMKSAHDTLTYACVDYDSEQEFNTFFCRCRMEVLDGFRFCMTAAPLVTWSYVEQWTGAALDKADTCPAEMDMSHPMYIEWEALSQVLDVVLSRLVQSEPRPNVVAGLQLLQRCVSATPQHPLVLSLLLSFVSALFVFLSCACSQIAGPSAVGAGAELLPRVLDKIFAALLYSCAPAAHPDVAVKNVRRHAAGLLVKLASKYPLLLLPMFSRLHEMVRATLATGELSVLESVTVQEALLLVANHLCCYERQSALVAEMLQEATAAWGELAPLCESPASLARLIGLSAPPEHHEQYTAARRRLLLAVSLTLGAVRRSAVPADPDKAARGGFGAGRSPAGHPLWRNPAAPPALPLLPPALRLLRALHALHAPGAGSLRHAGHARALQPPASEARALLAGGRGGGREAAPDAPGERLRGYVRALHEAGCQLAGGGAALGRDLYAAPGLARALCTELLAGLQYLPDHWLRPLVRYSLKPLLLHCPPAHYADVALPLLDHVAPMMLNHLTARWEYISSLYESGKFDEEAGGESQEVLEDILVRNLTKEYLDVLKVALVENGAGMNASVTEGEESMEEDNASAARAPDHVSELGALVLRAHVGPHVLHTLLRALTWGDSGASLRASSLALPALRAALSNPAGALLSAAEAHGALCAVLTALRVHGQHDANQAALLALAVQTYELLRPVFPNVITVLRSIPDVDAHDLHRLDEKVAANTNKPSKIDKSKRDLFKKITSKLIGRNVGQLFKKEVYILDLPRVPSVPKESRSALDAPEGAGLARLFAHTT